MDMKSKQALAAYTDLVRAIESVEMLLENQAAHFHLTLNQFQALAALLRFGTMTQADISAELFRCDSTVIVIVRNLEKKGLLVRAPHETDKRKWNISLTSAGEKLAARILPEHARLIRAQMAALGRREQKTLGSLCRKLREGDPLKFLLEMTLMDEDEIEED